jgi:two-component system response regulator BaeR
MKNDMILVVEDEPRLADVLTRYLERDGFLVRVIADGNGVIPWLRENEPCLILLDVMLPGRDGMDIMRELRHFSAAPVIMTTARVDEIDRLLGLELGADDYVCKPYSPREVVARVRAVLRRAGTLEREAETASGESLLQLDSASLRVRGAQGEVQLTAVEFQLLACLYRRPGRIFSRTELMDRIYGDGRVVSDRTIDSHVKKLRRKLGHAVSGQELVHSVYGVGYRYEPDVS